MATIAEQLRREGREEGRVEGREQGREEGREEGRREIAVCIAQRLLPLHDALTVSNITGLPLEVVQQLAGERAGLNRTA